MEERTSLIVGGVATLVASAVVICAVALSNTAALAESPGETTGVGISIVPLATTADAVTDQVIELVDGASGAANDEAPAAPDAGSVPTPEPVAPPVESPSTPVAPPVVVKPAPEVVPAPAPLDVAPAPTAQEALDAIIDAAEADITGDSVRRWAASQGWPEAKIESWIARLDERRESATEDRRENATEDRAVQQSSGTVVAEAEQKTTAGDSGTSRRGDAAGVKDRSRDSPDRRDR